MTTLIDFLEARLKEEQDAAELMAKYYPPPWDVYDRGWMARVYGDEPFWEVTRLEQGSWIENGSPPLGSIIEHVARHDPARVLREVQAKRALLAEHAPKTTTWIDEPNTLSCGRCGTWNEYPVDFPCATLRNLAAIYSDHPDYRKEWAA